ncbi:MAG: NUDIX domain-containing protein [Nanoarchaeota archaeon]
MEGKILDLFLCNDKLKFNEIEKLLKIRSNKLTYHLKNLLKKGILKKENSFYSLSETSESLIPYLSSKKSVLPVILVHIGDDKNSFLYKREKRPYKDKLSLPGGRILIGESIQEAVKRIMKEKFGIKAKFNQIKSLSFEHATKSGKVINSFLLILVRGTALEKIDLINVDKNKPNIISSDYKLIKSKCKNLNFNVFFTNA